jgi:hypothetical protein
MTDGILPQRPQTAREVWALFGGIIEQASVSRFFAGFTAAAANQVGHIHLLFQSTGGTVSDGVCLYNFS